MDDQLVYKELVQQEPLGPWQLIEVLVETAGTQKVMLPDLQQLRSMVGQDIIVKGISLVTDKVLTHAMNIDAVNAPLAELQKMTLVLFSERWQRGQMMPVLMMNPMADGDSAVATTIPYNNTPTKLDSWKNVDWPQSFLLYGNGTGGAANVPYVVMFRVDYVKLNAKGQPILT